MRWICPGSIAHEQAQLHNHKSYGFYSWLGSQIYNFVCLLYTSWITATKIVIAFCAYRSVREVVINNPSTGSGAVTLIMPETMCCHARRHRH